MIALAFGTVAEFQLRVVSVRAAADLALVAVASLRLRLLLLPDGGLELNGLSGPLTALDPQNALDILPEEDHKVQNCHHSGQSTGVGTVPHGPSDVPRHQSDVRPCQPLGLQRDHPVKPDLRVGIHHCEGQEHRQVDVIGVGQAPAVIPRGQREDHRGQHAEQHAAEIVQSKLGGAPLPLQRPAHEVAERQHDEQRYGAIGKGQQHKGHQPPHLAMKHMVEVKFQKAQGRCPGEQRQDVRHRIGDNNVEHQVRYAETRMAVRKPVDPLVQFLQNGSSCHSFRYPGGPDPPDRWHYYNRSLRKSHL